MPWLSNLVFKYQSWYLVMIFVVVVVANVLLVTTVATAVTVAFPRRSEQNRGPAMLAIRYTLF